MDSSISRSEKKRQAQEVEKLSQELAQLTPSELTNLPCEPQLKEEIAAVRDLTGGARKRQIKYLARELRRLEVDGLLAFLAERKGSRLKDTLYEKEIDRLRHAILDAAISEYQERLDPDERFRMDRETPALLACAARFPDFELEAAARAAEDFAATRKPGHARQLLKLIRGAAERRKFSRRARED